MVAFSSSPYVSRPAGCASCTGLRISETADTLEGATLGRNATRNPIQYPFKFIRMHGVWDFHPCQRPVTEPCMRNPGDIYFPWDRLLNTLGLLAGPYRFTLAWPVRGYTPATKSPKETGRKRSGIPLLRGFQAHTPSPVFPLG